MLTGFKNIVLMLFKIDAFNLFYACACLLAAKKDRAANGAGISAKPDSAKSSDTRPLLSNSDEKNAAPTDEIEELGDGADKELQQLADDHNQVNGSPPPTFDETSRTSSALSRAEDASAMPITAIATFKTLESPRTVVFSSSRPASTEHARSPQLSAENNIRASQGSPSSDSVLSSPTKVDLAPVTPEDTDAIVKVILHLYLSLLSCC